MDLSDLNLKQLLVPVGVCLGLVVLFVIGGKLAFDKIGELDQEEARLNSESVNLSQKLEVLRDFEVIASSVSSRVSQAVPSDNPSVLSISQIKSKSASTLVLPRRISIGRSTSAEGGLSYININFEVSADLDSITSFLDELIKTAPLGKVEDVELINSDTGFDASVIYRTFWAELPSNITSISEPLGPLTEEELATVQLLTSLEAPSVTLVAPQAQSDRVDPFGI